MRLSRQHWVGIPLAFSFCLPLLSCAATPKRSPAEQFAQAERDLSGWKSRWAPSGIPAENEDADNAHQARETFLGLKDNPDSSIDPEKLSFLLSESAFACNDLMAAFSQYRAHLENYPFAEKKGEAEKAIYQIAVLWSQRGGSFLGTGIYSDRGHAIDALQYLIDRASRSPEADDALKLLGTIHYLARDYDEAIAAFERIVKEYDKSEWRDTAEFFIAMSYLRRVRNASVDRAGLAQAEILLREHPLRWPESVFRTQAQTAYAEAIERLAEGEYEIGNFYARIGEPTGARRHWEATTKKFPKSRFAVLASASLTTLPPQQIQEGGKP